MAKLALVLIAVFANNVLASPISTDSTVEIKTKVEKIRDEVIASIETLNLDNVDKRRAIVSHSSEFANKIQESINTIFRIFVRVDERYSHRILPQVALHLNDIVHEVQEVLITKPSILKRTLKENVLKVSSEVLRLTEVLQHYSETHDECKLGHDVKDIIDKLINAMYQLRIRNEMHHHAHEINGRSYQSLSNEIISTLNKITWYDRNTYEILTKACDNFDHTLNHILRHFHNEIFHFEGKERTDFDDVVKNMQETRSQLDTVLHRSDYTDNNRKIEDLKTQLRLSIHKVDFQIQRLVKMGQDLNEDRTVVINNCIKNIVADSLHGQERVLWKLQDILRTHHTLNTM